MPRDRPLWASWMPSAGPEVEEEEIALNVPGQQELVPGQNNLSTKGDEPHSQTHGRGWSLLWHVARSNDFEPN